MEPSVSEPKTSLPTDQAPANSDSHESKLTPLEKAEIAFTNKYSSPDAYINGEQDTCWFHWQGSLDLKPLRFETRTGTIVAVLRSSEDTWLGKHRHRGPVTAVTLKGEMNYKELVFRTLEEMAILIVRIRYDWVARPGDYVVENPGSIHTLHMCKDTEVLVTSTGSLEFLNDDDTLKKTLDIFSFAQMYYEHCKKQGIQPNNKLWY
jgi:quercetin dioxygenase-like cupin family protein